MNDSVRKQLTPVQRSRIMASIKKKNTKPELLVRRFLHGQGLRFRLHAADLPGTPDLVFRSRRVAFFVHGCFWHRCPYCAAGRKEVRSNVKYWLPKLERNQLRDRLARESLLHQGWKVVVVWECQAANRQLWPASPSRSALNCSPHHPPVFSSLLPHHRSLSRTSMLPSSGVHFP